jgi:serine/threonine-protein kinase
LHQIGAGALGPVFRAYEPDQDRLAAVKVFRLDLPPERVHQFVAELEQLIAADLTHPSIAAPIAAGMSGNYAFLAQDFVAADSLDIVVRDHGPAPASDALRVATQLGGALDFAATVDVLHGAMHPRDVLISPDDTRVTGHGIARALERVGVPPIVRRPYTAPERAAGTAWDRRADVYTLAVLIFEMLAGKRLAAPERAGEMLSGVAGANAAALKSLFARALEQDPARRFDTALEFADALKSALTVSMAAPAPRRGLIDADADAGLPFDEVTPADSLVLTRTLEAADTPLDLHLHDEPVIQLRDDVAHGAGNAAAPVRRETHAPSRPEAAKPAEPAPATPASTVAQPPMAPPRAEPALSRSEPVPSPRAEPAARRADPVPPRIEAVGSRVERTAPRAESAPRDERVRDQKPAHEATRSAAREERKRRPAVIAPAPALQADAQPDLALAAAGGKAPTAFLDQGTDEFRQTALEKTRSAIWPLALAIGVGLVVGFAGGYGVAMRDRLSGSGDMPAMSSQVASNEPAAPASSVPPASAAPSGNAAPGAAAPQGDALPAPAPRGSDVEPAAGAAPGSAAPGAAGFATGAGAAAGPSAGAPAGADQRRAAAPEPAARRAADAPAASGRLVIRSTPAGARVTVDGRDAGTTPSTVRELARGPHNVRVAADGFTTEERRIVLTEDRMSQAMRFELARRPPPGSAPPQPAGPGSLMVESRPSGAMVLVDGKPIGTTPLAIESVPAGDHSLALESDGYQRWVVSVRVATGERARVTASLER